MTFSGTNQLANPGWVQLSYIVPVADTIGAGPSGRYSVTIGEILSLRNDHGGLNGLGDDDHVQYFNQTRGDARYSLLGHTHNYLSDAPSDGNQYVRKDGNWSILVGGGGGAVDSVNGQTGVVVLDAADVGAVASGTLAAVATTGVYSDLTGKPAVTVADLLSYGYVFSFRSDSPACDTNHANYASTNAWLATVGINDDNIQCISGFDPIAPSSTVVISGVGSTGAVGTIGVVGTGQGSVALVGVSSTGAIGALDVTASVAGDAIAVLSGVSANGALGTVSIAVTQDGAVSFTGVGATGAIAAVSVVAENGSVSVSDTFDGTGALSANWTVFSGSASRNADTAYSTVSSLVKYTGTTFPDNQYSQAKVYGVEGAGSGVFVRMGGTGPSDLSGYTTDIYLNEGVPTLELVRWLSGTPLSLGEVVVGLATAYVRIEVSGTSISVFYKTAIGNSWGTAVLTINNSAVSTGVPGFALTNASTLLDDFEAGGL